MHTLHRIHRGCDLVVHIGETTCTIEVDSAPRCIVMSGHTLESFEQIVANTVDEVLLKQWLFLRRPIDNGVTKCNGSHYCNRCGVLAPHTGCVECE